MYVGTLYFLLNVYPKTAQRLQSIKKKIKSNIFHAADCPTGNGVIAPSDQRGL